jgi:hypothetical protein
VSQLQNPGHSNARLGVNPRTKKYGCFGSRLFLRLPLITGPDSLGDGMDLKVEKWRILRFIIAPDFAEEQPAKFTMLFVYAYSIFAESGRCNAGNCAIVNSRGSSTSSTIMRFQGNIIDGR